jgi:predicted ATPase
MLPARGREHFLATWGVWFHKTMTGHYAEAYAFADDLVSIARELNDSDLLLEAYHARTPGLFWQGDLPGAKESIEELFRLYDRERHHDLAYYFGGHDPRVCAQTFYALSLWGLGYPDQSERMVRRCVEDARALGHSFSLAHALNIGSLTLLLLDDVIACQKVADELYPIAERNKFPWPLAQARFLRGWLSARQGDWDAGISQMLAAADEPSQAVLRPMLLALIAGQHLRATRVGDAVDLLERADNGVRGGTMAFFQPEIVRLRGEALLGQSPTCAGEADAAFRRAIALAARQSCRAFELRAGVSLARLLADDGRKAQARDLLAPIYAGFTEGFARADLQAAKALLAELA